MGGSEIRSRIQASATSVRSARLGIKITRRSSRDFKCPAGLPLTQFIIGNYSNTKNRLAAATVSIRAVIDENIRVFTNDIAGIETNPGGICSRVVLSKIERRQLVRSACKHITQAVYRRRIINPDLERYRFKTGLIGYVRHPSPKVLDLGSCQQTIRRCYSILCSLSISQTFIIGNTEVTRILPV